ncbi:MAG TPA: hypothetical protein DEG71_03245 [Clostridiales bacterium]|nr:hypothetical protein [Clostridiales bacterium]
MAKLTCVVCGKENTSDDLLYCSNECYNLDIAQPQKPAAKTKSKIKKPTHYPEPNKFYSCNCRSAGCIQCQPKKYL